MNPNKINIEPDIRTLSEKNFIGLRMKMSLAGNKTPLLWKSFMQRRKEIRNAVGSDLYSLQIFDPAYFEHFDPAAEFTKWALTEVEHFDPVPDQMETFVLEPGLYAVFHYKGSSAGTSIFQYIFTQWLPGSAYQLDSRPHFEVLGEKYQNNHPDSEEEIWIPIRKKLI